MSLQILVPHSAGEASLAGDIRVSRTFREIRSVKMLLPRTVVNQAR